MKRIVLLLVISTGAYGQTVFPPNGSGGSGAPAYTSPLFTAQTSVTVLGTSHLYATAALMVTAFDNSTPRNVLAPASISVNPSTFDVIVTFATAQTGYIAVNGGTGPAGPIGPTGPAGGLTKSSYYFTDGTNFYLGPLLNTAILPTVPSFTGVNFSGSTWTTSGGAKVMTVPSGTAGIAFQYVNYTPPKTLTVAFTEAAIATSGAGIFGGGCGPAFYNGTKIEYLQRSQASTTVLNNYGLFTYTNPTTFNASTFTSGSSDMFGLTWLKLQDDGANLIYSASTDGVNFLQIYSETYAASFIGASPGKIGFACGVSNSNNGAIGTLLSWSLI